jgi:cytochrome c oxidase accessory protein FixG
MNATSTAAPRVTGPRPGEDVSLYAKREAIYQKEVQGPWQRRRAVALFILAGVFLIGPWLMWGDRQAIWFDVPARRYNLFGLTFWPQDFIFLSWLLIIAAFSLFFFTALAGRLWCGYACPQTVWTKFFMWIEWLTEGDRNQRMRLDRGAWTGEKVLRKAAKHATWLLLAAVVGTTFVGYFIPIRQLLPRIAAFDLSASEWVFLAIASLALYADAGWMREQICKYACPYARFQGAMFDDSTLTIVYDTSRGEPRGHRARTLDHRAAGLGDCIDCGLCVHVCPTGIDIRDGTQYECIGCAACIDACDEIMEEVGYPKGLVRYDTDEGLAGKGTRVLRPRLVGYGAVLSLMITLFGVALWHRLPLAVDVLRDRARLYRETADGVENVYTLKIMNKDQRAHTYAISVEPAETFVLDGPAHVDVAAGGIKDVPVRVRRPERRDDRPDERPDQPPSAPVTFAVRTTDGRDVAVREKSRFLAPNRPKG